MDEVTDCPYCGRVDQQYDENSGYRHENSPKHMCNKVLELFKRNRKEFTGNRHGVVVTCSVSSSFETITNDIKGRIRLSAKPGERVTFSYRIDNETRNEQMQVLGVHLAHPQPQFGINEHGIKFGEEPVLLKPKSKVEKDILVTFSNPEIGHFEMPIIITVRIVRNNKTVIIVREMVVFVEEKKAIHDKVKSPYTHKDVFADSLVKCQLENENDDQFHVPKNLKTIFGRGLKARDYSSPEEKQLILDTQNILDTGAIKDNYTWYFHNLLWYEETIARINLKKYNMTDVAIQRSDKVFVLHVPGLAEKRPSLMRGDNIFLRPHDNEEVMYEGKISEIQDSSIHISGLSDIFFKRFDPRATFDVRFIMSRVPFERMHRATHNMAKHIERIFPQPNKKAPRVAAITCFFNPHIADNPEQRSAVEHIVAGTAGKAPYMVFGPPGTGKTITIVEAILQLVKKNASNRIMVCTDSNMAADHIACAILKHESQVGVPDLLLRVNSQFRVWEVMPKELYKYSNGHSYETFTSINNAKLHTYRVVVSTLSHSAKYGMSRSQQQFKLGLTHVFIDEAAQASEPACYIPVAGLLQPAGQLVLAGDPKQLGPVCVSRQASNLGLGTSLMERLYKSYGMLYRTDARTDSNYITMLKNNFRSHADILEIPNQLFYENQLRACAKPDPLSETDVLSGGGGQRAIVFHAVMSREQKEGKSPSFFNTKEIEMLQKYVLALIRQHGVRPQDIGVVTPYIRQMYKIRGWLSEQGYDVEVGTVEAFQGKEKRVIIITTVRANCKLLDYDAKYQLGFLVDDKRFNVALTRAKSKAIVIGNPTCLCRDTKWRTYMERCRNYGSYLGSESEQLERNAEMLNDLAITRFDRCGISEELNRIKNENANADANNNNKKKKKKKKAAVQA